uniref:aspartate-semialdehyde dehydrogenase n=1 Tax=Mantoniella antarctica TaxID=81844 RepID=A0A7S0SS05_9CHLO|eukprot:CAMPEP_0181371356 /NCGR_PEP_ID=MMETSP1106-20121128/14035_1 /TAXON_ID=81844 /ORGANISM="Mantoniella antarctica, Strain SL-175" /LENGTH=394 /DNA_ID=CAMNT_0023488449 /DNA_START=69 /DNA_END=1253 /DNA_ORIENTATION=-
MAACAPASLSLAGARAAYAAPRSRATFGRRAAVARSSSSRRTGSGAVMVRAGKTPDGPRVAIAGITGAVGQEFIRVLVERNFPYSEMKMLASARSAGKEVEFDGETYVIEELTAESFDGVDIALFSAGGSISKTFGPIAAEKGCFVVDNSSAFRMTEGVPLVIPEVNPEAMADFKLGKKKGGIIANPNCSTIIALMAVTPLHRAVGVKRMIASTYQAASGAGAMAMAELEQQTKEVLAGEPVTMDIFPFQYAFNLFSHNAPMTENGYNEEEMKMVKETQKIWDCNTVEIAATCIRVPVMRAHAESINLTFETELDENDARELLSKAAGLTIIDDRANNRFPTPLDATNMDNVYVGRIRQDISQPGKTGLEIFVCGDQIKKGAALNAVQIAELLL